MKTAELFNNKTVLSFEVFPPKRTASVETIYETLDELKVSGIDNILALRGDVSGEFGGFSDFKYACDLISFIKKQSDFNILAACYPEGHMESKSTVNDIRNLKGKVDAGASQCVTQESLMPLNKLLI